jgi:hypothetical protein
MFLSWESVINPTPRISVALSDAAGTSLRLRLAAAPKRRDGLETKEWVPFAKAGERSVARLLW